MSGTRLILAAVAAVGLAGGAVRADGPPDVAPAPRAADPRPGPGEFGASAYGFRTTGPAVLVRDGEKAFVEIPYQVRIQGGKGRTFEVELVPQYEVKGAARAFTDGRGEPVRYTATVTPDADSYVGAFTVRVPAAEAVEFSHERFGGRKVRGLVFRASVREEGADQAISPPREVLARNLSGVLFQIVTDRTDVPNHVPVWLRWIPRPGDPAAPRRTGSR